MFFLLVFFLFARGLLRFNLRYNKHLWATFVLIFVPPGSHENPVKVVGCYTTLIDFEGYNNWLQWKQNGIYIYLPPVLKSRCFFLFGFFLFFPYSFNVSL